MNIMPKKQQSQQQKGFTIVELLIVIVVIAILAAISIVAYNGIRDRARDSANMNNASALTKAIEMYKIDNDGTPPICAGGAGDSCPLSTLDSTLVPRYLPSAINDSDPTQPYNYVGVTSSSNGAWAIRMYKQSSKSFCKFGNYQSSLDTWYSSAPRC